MHLRGGVARSLCAMGVAAFIAAGSPPAAGYSLAPLTYVVTLARIPTQTDVDVLRGVATGVHAFEKLPAAVVTLPEALVPLLRNLPGVRGVWANERYQLLDQKANLSIRADQAWGPYTGGLGYTGSGWTGEGIGVGVIDAGVDGTHPDLCAQPVFCKGTPVKTVQNVKFIGNTDRLDPYVAVEDVVSTDNSSGHGTHVAGIAVGYGTASTEPGKYQGVAPGAHLVGMGTGEVVEVVNVLAAFEYSLQNAARYNIKVLNNSWGPGYGTPYDPDHPVNLAIDAAWNAGISVVFGAGNDGPRTDALNAFSVNPHAISVAGTNKNTGHLGFFSSRGVPGSPFWHPTVGAPGENIIGPRALTGTTTHAGDASSANPEPMTTEDTPYYGNVNGTSMASPHVAGVVALMQQASYESRGVYLTPQQVKDILQNTAQNGGASGLPNYQQYSMGAGLVDAKAATDAAAAGAFPSYDDGVTYDVRSFKGTVGPAAVVPTSTFESTFDVAPGALSVDVMIDWKVQYANDVDMTVYDPSGVARGNTQLLCTGAQPNGYSSFCSSAPNERLTFTAPAPGTWRVVVGGFLNTTEDVRGLWSAAYPDGTAGVAPPAAPAAISLTASLPLSTQGQPIALTAAVADAAGNPVPNVPVVWSSTGAGTIANDEAYTAGDGVAGASALSDAPGDQTITVTAGALTASTSVTWLGLTTPCLTCAGAPPNTTGEASGGGWFAPSSGAKRHFGVGAEYNAGAAMPGGSLTYRDASYDVRANVVDTFRIDGAKATLTGPATVNGSTGYRYVVTVTDNGEPGRTDVFEIKLTRSGDALWSYTSTGTLGGGNIQVAPGG